jgi:hypothetical protein
MSLYGSGRSEGIAAALLIGALVVAVRSLAAALDGADLLQDPASVGLAALGGMLCYRFLRAQGRSRFTGFLVGAGYGLSPWLLALAAMPREQLAATLAPLALEATCRLDRPTTRNRWLPWAPLCFAAPFLGGGTMVAMLVTLLVLAGLVRTVTCGDRDDERPPLRGLLLAALATAAAAANLVWLDPLAPWLGVGEPVPPQTALTAHRLDGFGVDLAAMLRVPGPALLTFALLGLLRRQRHVDASTWLGLATAGAVPTVLTLWPALAHALPDFLTAPFVLTAAWWLTLLACAVLGAAGLDDFLDLPLRRRTALPWLLAIVLLATPVLPTFLAKAPTREWPVASAMLGLALVLPTWRRLGILNFKNVLATVALLALAIPSLQVPPRATAMSLAAPLGESRPHPATATAPPWHYSGFAAAALLVVWLGWSAIRRSRNATPAPKAAKAAIVKKAKPSQRS